MKVLVIGVNYAPEPTGIAPYTASMAAGLAARGHRVRVLTTMPHYPEWRIAEGYPRWSSQEAIAGVRVTRLRHYVPRRPAGVRRLLSEVTFGVRALLAPWGRPDVVVLVSPALFASAITMVRSRLAGIPSVVWLQDVYSLGIVETEGRSSAGAVARLITATEKAVLSAANGVCVIHDRFTAVAKRLGAKDEALVVVRNWTHVSPSEDTKVAAIRDLLGWPPDVVVALHSGAMGHKQDLGNVVESARIAADRGSPVRFVLMGDGSERGDLEESAAELKNIDFIDPLPDELYAAALQSADVLLVNEHAGLREMAVPSKLTSYFASGRPVIAATDPGSVTAAELTAAGSGIRVSPRDPGVLLDTVLELRAAPAESARLGRNGLQYYRTTLQATTAIDRFAAWLEMTAASGRGRPTTAESVSHATGEVPASQRS